MLHIVKKNNNNCCDLPELRFFFLQVQKNSIISFLFGFGDTNVLAKSECKQGKPDKACVRYATRL